MKRIAIMLTLCMMLAGCTEPTSDTTGTAELTNQDLEGAYIGPGLGIYVDMNADDTFELHNLEIHDCYDTEEEVNSTMAELNSDEYYQEERDLGSNTSLMVANNCLYFKWQVADEEEKGISTNYSLGSFEGTPYIEIIITEKRYQCDDGEEIRADWVNDDDEDCSGGEDEAEGAADSLESVTREVRSYLSADGYGTISYPEGVIGDEAYCMVMGPKDGMFAFYQAVKAMDNLTEEELENFDVGDLSTYPTSLKEMFTVYDQNYAASAASDLISSDCKDLEPMLVRWLDVRFGPLIDFVPDSTRLKILTYDFSVSDASGTPTSYSNEPLVTFSMDKGDDLRWSSLAVQISVDGSSYITCTNPYQDSETGCAISDREKDTVWGTDEEATIYEGSDDICEGPCEIQIKILDIASNRLVYESSIVSVE
jgi:hypothetical protein